MFNQITSKTGLYGVLFTATFFLAAWANINVGIVFQPVHIFNFELTLTGGDIFFPLVYIINDLAAEFFGKKKAIKLSVIASLLFTILAVISYMTTFVPNISPEYASAARVLFAFSPRAAISGVIALLVGTTLNAYVFEAMKNRGTGFKRRAWVSTMIGELGDSVLVTFLMFAGLMPMSILISMIVTQYILKLCVEGILVAHTEKIAKQLHQQIDD